MENVEKMHKKIHSFFYNSKKNETVSTINQGNFKNLL